MTLYIRINNVFGRIIKVCRAIIAAIKKAFKDGFIRVESVYALRDNRLIAPPTYSGFLIRPSILNDETPSFMSSPSFSVKSRSFAESR